MIALAWPAVAVLALLIVLRLGERLIAQRLDRSAVEAAQLALARAVDELRGELTTVAGRTEATKKLPALEERLRVVEELADRVDQRTRSS